MNLLKNGDTIGIISPSWVANQNDYEKYAEGIEKLGFHVKFGKNIYKDTYKPELFTVQQHQPLKPAQLLHFN